MIYTYHAGDLVLVPMLVKSTDREEGTLTLHRLDGIDKTNSTTTVPSLHVEHTGLNFTGRIGVRCRFHEIGFFEGIREPKAQERFGKWWPDIENYARAANAGTQELPVVRRAWYHHGTYLMRYTLHIPLYACELSDDEKFGDGCKWIETTDTFRSKPDTKCLDPDEPVRAVRIIVFDTEIDGVG